MPVSSGTLSFVVSLPFPQHQSKIRTCFGFSGLALHPVPTISLFPAVSVCVSYASQTGFDLCCAAFVYTGSLARKGFAVVVKFQFADDESAPAPAQRHPPECCSRHHRPTPRSLVFGRTENLLPAIRHTIRQPHWTLDSGLWPLTPPLGPYTDVKERIGKCRRLQDF